MPISQTQGYFEIPNTVFRAESMLFLTALRENLYEKFFSSVKTKINPNFAVKHAKRSNHSFLLFI